MLQAEHLDFILNALTHQSDEAGSLARLELARSLGRNGQVWRAFDAAPMPSSPLGFTLRRYRAFSRSHTSSYVRHTWLLITAGFRCSRALPFQPTAEDILTESVPCGA